MSVTSSMNNKLEQMDGEQGLDIMTFRHRVLQNPWELDAEVTAFLAEHPEQKSWVKQVREQDQAVRQVLKQTPAPENLADKILLQTVGEQAINPKTMTFWSCIKGMGQIIAYRWRQAVLGLKHTLDTLKGSLTQHPAWLWSGAGLAMGVLSISLLLPQFQHTQSSTPQVAAVIDTHNLNEVEKALVDHVQKHKTLTQKQTPVDQQTLEAYLESVGAQLAGPMDFVTHVSECNINGMKGIHVVIQSFSGPVTVVVLPKVKVPQMMAFQKQIFHGELIPVKGATVAVLGKNMTQVGWAQMAFLKYVKFGKGSGSKS